MKTLSIWTQPDNKTRVLLHDSLTGPVWSKLVPSPGDVSRTSALLLGIAHAIPYVTSHLTPLEPLTIEVPNNTIYNMLWFGYRPDRYAQDLKVVFSALDSLPTRNTVIVSKTPKAKSARGYFEDAPKTYTPDEIPLSEALLDFDSGETLTSQI